MSACTYIARFNFIYQCVYRELEKPRVLTDGIVDIRVLCEVTDNSMFLSTKPIFMYFSLLLFTIHYRYIAILEPKSQVLISHETYLLFHRSEIQHPSSGTDTGGVDRVASHPLALQLS